MRTLTCDGGGSFGDRCQKLGVNRPGNQIVLLGGAHALAPQLNRQPHVPETKRA